MIFIGSINFNNKELISNMKRILCIIVIPIIIIAACKNNYSNQEPLLTTTNTSVPTKYPTIRQNTEKPENTISPTKRNETVTQTPSLTPLSTLSEDDAQNLILRLLSENGDCYLPCYWGFSIGETRYGEVRQLLNSISSDLISSKKAIGILYRTTGGPSPGYSEFGFKDDVLESIYAYEIGTEVNHEISRLLSSLGKPVDVYLSVFRISSGDKPFYLIIFYPFKGIMAIYKGNAILRNGEFHSCPQNIGPELTIWDPEIEYTIEDIDPFGDIEQIYSLEFMTGLSNQEFFEIYSDPENNLCLVTDAEFRP